MRLHQKMKGIEFLTVAAAAEEFGVSVATVRRWCDVGGLEHVRNPCNDYRLIPRAAIDRFFRQLGAASRDSSETLRHRPLSQAQAVARLRSRINKLLGLLRRDLNHLFAQGNAGSREHAEELMKRISSRHDVTKAYCLELEALDVRFAPAIKARLQALNEDVASWERLHDGHQSA